MFIHIYLLLAEELDRYAKGTGVFHCVFQPTEDADDSGKVYIASRSVISLLLTSKYKVKDEGPALSKALSKAKRAGEWSWLETYELLEQSSSFEEFSKELGSKLDFDQLIDFANVLSIR